jgi:hypothetical protein
VPSNAALRSIEKMMRAHSFCSDTAGEGSGAGFGRVLRRSSW